MFRIKAFNAEIWLDVGVQDYHAHVMYIFNGILRIYVRCDYHLRVVMLIYPKIKRR